MDKEHQIPIWFFIGLLLGTYGLLIFGTGIYGLFYPPKQVVALSHLHAGIWWGILLLVLGSVYIVKFRPSKGSRKN